MKCASKRQPPLCLAASEAALAALVVVAVVAGGGGATFTERVTPLKRSLPSGMVGCGGAAAAASGGTADVSAAMKSLPSP